MKCINCPSPPLSLYMQRSKHEIRQSNKLNTLQINNNNLSFPACRALPDPVFLATIAPPGGKLSVLLQTGGVCLIAYWVANFVVPAIVLKDLQSKATEEKDEDEF